MNWMLVLQAMLPEHLLLAGLLLLLVLGSVAPGGRGAAALAMLATLLAAVASLWLASAAPAAAPFPGQFSLTAATALAKALLLAFGFVVLLLSRDDFTGHRYYALLLGSLYGACLLCSADSFATLFLGIEILSLPVYVLVLLAFQRPGGDEAALKYLVLGGTATASLLLGIALLYGGSGSLALSTFGAALGGTESLALGGVALVLAALYLKSAIVPLHAWAPDAYEAASVPVTAYMATVVKAGVLLAALRVFGTAALGPVPLALLAALPLASMAWGNLAALRQRGFRRTIAYSSIAHAGYLWFALLGDGPGREAAVVFYLATYGAATLLAFCAFPAGGDDAAQDELGALQGLAVRRPRAALALAVAMLSLSGLPPFPGFVAKFLVFRNVVAAGHWGLALAGLLASYLGIYFYLRIIQHAYMRTGLGASAAGLRRRHAWAAAVLCTLAILALALAPGTLLGRL